MSSLARSTQTTNPAPDAWTLDPDSVEADPADWPSWTDLDCWVPTDPGPAPDDQAWAVREFNDDDDDELAAPEAPAQHSGGLGLIPPDIAAAINATSVAGLCDAILHSGSDERFCSCEPCVWERTRRYAE